MTAHIDHLLLVLGVVLLASAALLGFMQARAHPGSVAAARWRVVHAGGATGAVQLIALAAVWSQLTASCPPLLAAACALGVAAASCAFFIGPLLHALGDEVWYRRVNLVGAVFAVPGYLMLPLLLVL
jgi:hypothetical protein